MPNIPGLMPQGMRPTGMTLGSEQVMAFLQKQPRYVPPDSDDNGLPEGLHAYAAGLQPQPKPEGAAWQQEIIYEKLGKTDLEITSVARYYFKIAQNYDEYLSRERITASQYYAGKTLGDEQPGRSQIVMTVVRDTIRQTLPSLLRVFTAVDDPVTSEPISSEITGNDQLATTLSRQATDYCRWALFTANPGWMVLVTTSPARRRWTRKAGAGCGGGGSSKRHLAHRGGRGPTVAAAPDAAGRTRDRWRSGWMRRPMSQVEQSAVSKTQDGQMYLASGRRARNTGAPPSTRTAQQSVACRSRRCRLSASWVVADASNVADARAVWHVRDVTASHLIEMGLPARTR